MCDDARLGVTLIFYLQNTAEYLSEKNLKQTIGSFNGASLAALSCEGMIILPVEKTEHKIKNSDQRYTERNKLIAQAREGDEEAIENLTIEDMDMYSLLSKRIAKEDILSIVTSYFMPYGIESDQYVVIGEILNFYESENSLTNEKLWILNLNCNNLVFDICINQNDLLGEPQVGRRFKGRIWLQGHVNFGY